MGAKQDSLKYHGNLSPETIAAMKSLRAKFIELAGGIEIIEEATKPSRETSAAFTHLEQSMSYLIKHLCLVDPQAVKEEVV